MPAPDERRHGMVSLASAMGMGCWVIERATDGSCDSLVGGYCHVSADPYGGLPALLEAVHPGDRDGLRAAAEQAARDGRALDFAFRGADMPVKFLRIAAKVLERAGTLMLEEGILVDDTAHVLAEARLAMVTESTPALLWIMEPNGFCSFFSKSWYDYTGQSAKEALGMGWLQKVHPEDLGMAIECASRAVQLKTHFRIEHRLRHRDGSWRWVLCVGNPRFDERGHLLGHSGVVTDIHERRAWERRSRHRDEHPHPLP